jgi:hypothetical protein
MGKQLGDPPALERPLLLGLPDIDRLIQQVAHHLPADDRVAGEQPGDHRIV